MHHKSNVILVLNIKNILSLQRSRFTNALRLVERCTQSALCSSDYGKHFGTTRCHVKTKEAGERNTYAPESAMRLFTTCVTADYGTHMAVFVFLRVCVMLCKHYKAYIKRPHYPVEQYESCINVSHG